jgi:hypothetical protein
MSDTMIALFGCSGMLLFGALGLAYVITSFGRKKSECPKCGKKTVTKKALVVDQTTGENVEGERDFGFALVSAIGGLLIGAGLCAFVLSMVIPALGDESCSLEGIVLKCVSYAGNMRLETTINLPIAFFALIGGLGAILNGVGRMRRAIATRGKPMTCEFECPSCKHAWTEEVAAPEKTFSESQ